MVYTDRNFKTKKQLIEAFALGEAIGVYQPGPFGPTVRDGQECIQGPHNPQPHTWACIAIIRDGAVYQLKVGTKLKTVSELEAVRAKSTHD